MNNTISIFRTLEGALQISSRGVDYAAVHSAGGIRILAGLQSAKSWEGVGDSQYPAGEIYRVNATIRKEVAL